MKKQLPTNAIANELSGASVFFQPKTAPAPPSNPPHAQETGAEDTAGAPTALARETNKPEYQNSPIVEQLPNPVSRDDVIPRHHDTVTPHDHEAQPFATPGALSAAAVERIRKAVKQFGKEAATHRFTLEEKRLLADIVYHYERRGYRTSENEITRIAINWLLLNYQEDGEQGVLARLLEALHR